MSEDVLVCVFATTFLDYSHPNVGKARREYREEEKRKG